MTLRVITKCTLSRLDRNNSGSFVVRIDNGPEFVHIVDLSYAQDNAHARRIIRRSIAVLVAYDKVRTAPKNLDMAGLVGQDIVGVVSSEIDDDNGVSITDQTVAQREAVAHRDDPIPTPHDIPPNP